MEEPIDEELRGRFMQYASGEGAKARLERDGLRNLLECTDTFCMSKHWLPDSYVESVYEKYATRDGIGINQFARIFKDGLLLTGCLEQYEKAFAGIDRQGSGVISRSQLGQLFSGLGRVLSPSELDQIVEEADIGHDGIDLADFLGMARTHLKLAEVLKYLQLPQEQGAELPVDLSSPLLGSDAGMEIVTSVHGMAELNAIVNSGAEVIVKLAFTWCRPCKAFWPKYQKFAKIYKKTRFLKIVGNENDSCKHYARDILKAKISPMFAVYSGGELISTWTGANNERFVSKIEEHLQSASQLAEERAAAIAADSSLAPK